MRHILRTSDFGTRQTADQNEVPVTEVVPEVTDILGRNVAVLASGIRVPGRHRVLLDASRLSPGTYTYRLTTETTQVQRTFVVVR